MTSSVDFWTSSGFREAGPTCSPCSQNTLCSRTARSDATVICFNCVLFCSSIVLNICPWDSSESSIYNILRHSVSERSALNWNSETQFSKQSEMQVLWTFLNDSLNLFFLIKYCLKLSISLSFLVCYSFLYVLCSCYLPPLMFVIHLIGHFYHIVFAVL